MRTLDEYRAILTQWETVTQNKSHIAKNLGIPRGTVCDCIKQYGSVENFERTITENGVIKNRVSSLFNPIPLAIQNAEWRKEYAYLLGLYLGDGCIDLMKNGRSFRLRIAQDKRYTGLIQKCVDTINVILPTNKVLIANSIGCVMITVTSTQLVKLFPQHGAGPKYKRKLTFDDWQWQIIDEFPLEVFRGLFHSDGCRSQNIVKGKNYVRYMFGNKSEDILALFQYVCDKLNLHWTLKIPTKSRDVKVVYISLRDDVAYLDEAVGEKY